MKALSGYAEWFWLMAKNWKDVENRPRPLPRNMATELPVRICLHTSKGTQPLGLFPGYLRVIKDRLTPIQWAEFSKVDWQTLRGKIIGEITITRQMRKRTYIEADHVDIGSQQRELQLAIANKEPCMSPWFFGPFGYVVNDGILYEHPIPYKGQLGFFDVKIPQIGSTVETVV